MGRAEQCCPVAAGGAAAKSRLPAADWAETKANPTATESIATRVNDDLILTSLSLNITPGTPKRDNEPVLSAVPGDPTVTDAVR